MRVFITIICLLGGMLHAEGRGNTIYFISSSASVNEETISEADSTSDLRLLTSQSNNVKTNKKDFFTTLEIHTDISTLCSKSNIYFSAQNVDETVGPFSRVEWDMGEPGLTFTKLIPPGHPVTIPPDNRWMNTPSFQYNGPGTRTITLIIYPQNASLQPLRATRTITVFPRPEKPELDPNIKTTICQGAAIEIKVKAPNPPNTDLEVPKWFQLVGGSWNAYSGTTPNPVPPTTLIGKVEYKVSLINKYGCEGDMTFIDVNVVPAPTAPPVVSSPVNICEGTTPESLDGKVTKTPSSDAVWYLTNNPNEIGSTTPPTINTSTPSPKKIYYVSLKSQFAGCGETDRSPIEVIVQPKPKANVSILGETVTSIEVCQSSVPRQVIFNATAGEKPFTVTYKINGGTELNQIINANTFQVPVPTNNALSYNVELTKIKDKFECQNNINTNAVINILPLPEATITGKNDFCLNENGATLTFSATGGTKPYKFTYELNNSGTDQTIITNGSSVILTPNTASSGVLKYDLKSIEYDNAPACKQAISLTKSITVHEPPSPPTIPTTPVSFCKDINGAALPTVTPTTGHTLKWYGTNLTGGTATPTPPIPDVSIVRDLKYYVSQYENVLGCESNRTEIKVTINPLPSVKVSIDGNSAPNPRYCQDAAAPTLMFNTFTGKPPYNLSYTNTQIGSGASSNENVGPVSTSSISIPNSTLGITRYLNFKIRDNNGCEQDLSDVLTVEILPTPSASISASTSEVCMNTSAPTIQFTGSLGPAAHSMAYTFEYEVNGTARAPITTATGNNTKTETQLTTKDGTFEYTLKAVSYTVGSTTCVNNNLSSTARIIVHPLPVATLTAEAASILRCKDGSRPDLTFRGTIGAPPYTFEYTRDGVAMSASGTTFLEKVSTSIVGNIQYRLTGVTDAKGCRQAATGTVDIEVAPIPTVNAGPEVWMMAGQRPVLKANAGNALGLTYSWRPSMYLNDPTILQPAASPPTTTTFRLTVTSNRGCTNSADVRVNVLFQPEIPNTFTPNGDGYNDLWTIEHLPSYPNAIVEVYNTAGQIVFRSTGFYKPWDGTRNGRPLPVGTYYYVIHTQFMNEKRSGFITLLR